MRKLYDMTAVTGEYQSGGQTKKRYQNIGAVFEREDGSMCAKIENIPVGPGWNGWINFFEPRERNQGVDTGTSQGGGQSYGGSPASDDLDQDIPF